MSTPAGRVVAVGGVHRLASFSAARRGRQAGTWRRTLDGPNATRGSTACLQFADPARCPRIRQAEPAGAQHAVEGRRGRQHQRGQGQRRADVAHDQGYEQDQGQRRRQLEQDLGAGQLAPGGQAAYLQAGCQADACVRVQAAGGQASTLHARTCLQVQQAATGYDGHSEQPCAVAARRSLTRFQHKQAHVAEVPPNHGQGNILHQPRQL